jgi:hypothetical protein
VSVLGAHPAWVAAFREWFGLPRCEARVLLALYMQGGEPIDPYALSQAAGVTEQSIATHVCSLRTALPNEALDQVRSRGYRLSEIGMEECRGAARSMALALKDEEPSWPGTITTTR